MTYDLLIVGAGPSGLACALHARRHGLSYLIVEKGTVVDTIVRFPTAMTFFSTIEKLELADLPFTSPSIRPSRAEAVEYYQGIARKQGLNIALYERVEQAERTKEGGFTVKTSRGEYHARFVVVATGYFDQTNRLNVPGEDLPKVHHYYREPYEYIGRDVIVVGGRNSAVETALDLYRHGARVTIVHRGNTFGSGVKYWLRPDIENRVAEGAIAVRWNTVIEAIEEDAVVLRETVTGATDRLRNDTLFALIGYRPDVTLLEACGILYDPKTLIPVYDPATFETNVPGLFLAGSVACGCQTWEIFIENGREHAEVVAREIALRIEGVRGHEGSHA